MHQKLYTSHKLVNLKKYSTLNEDIFPFTEEPSTERFSGEKKEQKNIDMDGDALFCLFTANIINEQIVFTR